MKISIRERKEVRSENIMNSLKCQKKASMVTKIVTTGSAQNIFTRRQVQGEPA